jgi:hypothetical protein
MGTRYLFEKAVKISQNLSPPEKAIVKNLCHTIRKSQEELTAVADDAMCWCIMKCKGICCRSLDIDSIFSLWDFIFILMLKPGLKDEIQQRLNAHSSLYLSPCPFLMNGKGPCIFPDGIKAQICVITFCSNDEKLRKPVKAVNLNFYKLCWQIQYLRVKWIALKMNRLFSGAESKA